MTINDEQLVELERLYALADGTATEARATRARLVEDDMLGLECSDTVLYEQLRAKLLSATATLADSVPALVAEVRALRTLLAESRKHVRTYNVRPCDDPQCGDSTWDHHCTERDVPNPLAQQIDAALGKAS